MSLIILSYGHDPLLLKTRDLILSREGFRVLTAIDTADACRILAGQSIDLLLLCHTLSEQELQTILDATRALRRPPSVLTLATNTFSSLSPAEDAVFETLNGPGKFLAAVRGLIATNGTSSPHQPNNGAESFPDTRAQ